jgi:hypothetical protein
VGARAQRLRDAVKDAVPVLQNLVVPEPQDAPASLTQQCIAPIVIARFGMLPAIGFDDQPGLRAREIDDIWRDRELPPKPPAELISTERLPKYPLGLGRHCRAIVGLG